MSAANEVIESSGTSIGDLLRWRVEETPKNVAFLVPDRAPVTNTWRKVSYQELKDETYECAAGLISLGLKFEERVAIASTTRYEWILADLGIQCAGAATTTIYPNTRDDEVQHILTDSQSVMLFAENCNQVEKIQQFKELDGQVRYIFLFDDDRTDEQKTGDSRVMTMKELVRLGKDYLAALPDCVDKAIDKTNRETLSTLIYTSGTTGIPKGVVLPHGRWTALARGLELMDLATEDDLEYLWLPLSHVFGKALIAAQLQIGFQAAVDGRIDRIVTGLGEVKPTLMCGAPRIYEKVRAAVLTKYPPRTLRGRISRWAFAVGRDSRKYRMRNQPMPKVLAAKYQIAEKLVFSKLKETMGGRIKFLISGSAKLSAQVQEWFYSAGIILTEGYGLTETTAVAFYNSWKEPRPGTVGKITPGNEVMIADDGEILIRGPIVAAGYHNLPEQTAEAFDEDGWFHTGDLGSLDDEGFLTVTDRKKDLMKTSGGKYVAPQKVEAAIVANIPYVSQAIAVGDGHKYITALVALDKEALLKWGQNHGHPDASYEELSQNPEVYKSLEKMMARANSKLERWETVKKFAILPGEIDVESGGVTASLKVKRKVVEERYADLINSLYPVEAGAVA